MKKLTVLLMSFFFILTLTGMGIAGVNSGATDIIGPTNGGNWESTIPAVSADGNIVAFVSSDALVPDDTNGVNDIYLYDREKGETTRVSVSSNNQQGDYWSESPTISADGRYIAFVSKASNLVEGDINWALDVFVHDRDTKETKRISGVQGYRNNRSAQISANGRFVVYVSSGSGSYVYDIQTEETSFVGSGSYPYISSDGRYVAYISTDNNQNTYNASVLDRQTGETKTVGLIGSRSNPGIPSNRPVSVSDNGRYIAYINIKRIAGLPEVFVYDVEEEKSEMVSVSDSGEPGHGMNPMVSADGKYVLFESYSGLVSNDVNNLNDIYIRDRQAGKTELVSVSSDGTPGNSRSEFASFSLDGRFVVFTSISSNLTPRPKDWIYVYIRDRGVLDNVPPTTNISLSGSMGQNNWYTSDVKVTLTATDNKGGLGLAKTEYSLDNVNWITDTASFTLSSEGSNNLYYRSTDNAGNVESTKQEIINIDKTTPQVTINIPADGGEYLLNENVLADWSAADELSGLASATGTGLNGQAIDTSAAGTKTFSVFATDNAGNQVTKTVTYRVGYDYTGILQPVKDDGSSVFKQGSTIPVKFHLKDANGNFVSTSIAQLYVAKVENGVTGIETEAVSTSSGATDNLFRYDNTDNQYIFNLATKELSTGIWQLRIVLDDGTSKYVNITLK